MLLPRFYLFYIHIIVLRYIAFSRYIFVVLWVFCIKSRLVYGVLPCIFIASFECISPCLARNQARFISLLPPYHRVFHSLICVFLGAWRISIWQQRRYIGWLVGWLVGWFDYVLLGSLGSDKLWLADRSLSCLFLTKYYHHAVFRVVYTRLKHCQNIRFSAIFEKFIFYCFHHCLVAL